MPAAFADMVNEKIGAESLVATSKRTSEIALALVASDGRRMSQRNWLERFQSSLRDLS
jgi:hypothetical protein